MNAQNLNLRGYAIVLGAGASRGASVGPHSPPLDAEFLEVARRLLCRRGRQDDHGRAWADFAKRLRHAGLDVGKIGKWRLEQLSTYLEARANMPSLQHKAGRPADYSAALDSLNQIICRTLERSNGLRSCPFHKALFEVAQPSCVITFNYDLIADQSLLEIEHLGWARRTYAGSSLLISRKEGNPYVRPRPRLPRGTKAPLFLKLHGSMNWSGHERGGGFSLVAAKTPNASLEYAGPPPRPLVVPPVSAKMDIQRGALRELWREAARALRTARGWIIWGYSFPPTDTVAQVLCRTALAPNRRGKPVLVINPDSTVAERIVEVLQKVRVQRWPSIERFLFDQQALRVDDGMEGQK